MSKKLALTITVILLLLIGLVIFMKKSIFQNEGTSGISENGQYKSSQGARSRKDSHLRFNNPQYDGRCSVLR